MKELTHQYKLSDPKTGGIRSYGLAITLICFFDNIRGELKTASSYLLDFLFYFGFEYVYRLETGPNLNTVMKLDLYDPYQVYNPINLGESINVEDLQNLFRITYLGLHTTITKSASKWPHLSIVFEMNKILKPKPTHAHTKNDSYYGHSYNKNEYYHRY